MLITIYHFIPAAQNAYLPFLNHTDTNIASDILLSCDDCSSLEIVLPYDFPFGGYYHQSVYVSCCTFTSFTLSLNVFSLYFFILKCFSVLSVIHFLNCHLSFCVSPPPHTHTFIHTFSQTSLIIFHSSLLVKSQNLLSSLFVSTPFLHPLFFTSCSYAINLNSTQQLYKLLTYFHRSAQMA